VIDAATLAIGLADYADPHDAADVVALLDAYARDPMGGGAALDERVKARLAGDLAANPHAFSMIARSDDAAVGLANCFMGYSTFAAAPLVNIHDLAVLPDTRGAGIGKALMAAIEQLASFAPDFEQVLDRLAQALHEIQLVQLVPNYRPSLQRVPIKTFAQHLDPQLVQLWYQMAVMGRRDLHFAPGARVGFEMSLLRMLAFMPAGADAQPVVTRSAPPVQTTASPSPSPAPRQEATAPPPAKPEPVAAAVPADIPDTAEHWLQLLARLALKGPLGQLGAHSGFVARNGSQLLLSYPADLYESLSPALCERFQNALSEAFGSPVQLKFEKLRDAAAETLHGRQTESKLNRQNQAEAEFQNHPVVNALLAEGSQIVPDSIRPLELK
jgi:DNA polymerase-3 subunit gamma/tau